MSSGRRPLAASFVAVALSVASFEAVAQDGELQRHRALWEDAGPQSYMYGYNKYCDCHPTDPPETVVTVANGAVTRVYHLLAGSSREVPAREGSLELYWTIEDLFELIDSAMSAGAAATRVRYDDTFGYPVSIYVDYDSDLVGDELDLRITRLVPAEPRR
jgi:Family of unknown function (DUF6174)